MLKLLIKIGNPLNKLILRTPVLHRLLSGTVMLMTLTGRRSGRRITTPVNYVRDGDTLTVVTYKSRRWWRNFEGGAPVTVLLRRRKLEGTAAPVIAGVEATAETLEEFYNCISPIRISPERVALLAPARVVIRVSLSADFAD